MDFTKTAEHVCLVSVILRGLKAGLVLAKLEEFVVVKNLWGILVTNAAIVKMVFTLLVQLAIVR